MGWRRREEEEQEQGEARGMASEVFGDRSFIFLWPLADFFLAWGFRAGLAAAGEFSLSFWRRETGKEGGSTEGEKEVGRMARTQRS